MDWINRKLFWVVTFIDEAVFFGFTGELNTTYVITKDLCPCTTKAVVRAASDRGVAFILLPCPMGLFK